MQKIAGIVWCTNDKKMVKLMRRLCCMAVDYCFSLHFSCLFNTFVKFPNELFENQGINIFSKLVKQKPITHTLPTAYALHFVHHSQSGSRLEQNFSKSWHS